MLPKSAMKNKKNRKAPLMPSERSMTITVHESQKTPTTVKDTIKAKKKKDKKDGEPSAEGGGGDDVDDVDGSSGLLDARRFAEQRRLIAAYETAHGEDDDIHDRKADYTYEDMLDRVMGILHAQNPDLIEKKRRTMKPPQLTRVGTKKTLWVNFQEICTMMQRSPQHVFQFFMAELGTEGSIDGNQRLVIRGKYVPKYIESLLRKTMMMRGRVIMKMMRMTGMY